MRHPFFNMTRLLLEEGESDFNPLEGHEGIVVTLGPNTSFFDRPGRSVARWPGTKTVPRRTPHAIPRRSWIRNEFSAFMRILCGGGDVKFNMIKTLTKQREILLTAGDGSVVEKIDLAELAKEGAPPLLFLQTAYLCSSANLLIQSVPCNASAMSWSRAPYAYKTLPLKNSFKARDIVSVRPDHDMVRAVGTRRKSRLCAWQHYSGDLQCCFQAPSDKPVSS